MPYTCLMYDAWLEFGICQQLFLSPDPISKGGGCRMFGPALKSFHACSSGKQESDSITVHHACRSNNKRNSTPTCTLTYNYLTIMAMHSFFIILKDRKWNCCTCYELIWAHQSWNITWDNIRIIIKFLFFGHATNCHGVRFLSNLPQ